MISAELIVGLTALITALFTGLRQFKHSECCWGGFELDRGKSYEVDSNALCNSSGSSLPKAHEPCASQQVHSHNITKDETKDDTTNRI